MQKEQIMNIQSRTPCHQAFQLSQRSRAKSPLNSGAYKLREAQRFIQRYMESIYAIRDYFSHPKKFYPGAPLGHCTTEDKATYLKRIPESIAELLGRDIMPAIEALTGDGLSRREIAVESEIAKHRTQNLLQDCEIQHKRLRAGIKDEYQSMKTGYSDLYGLLQDAEGLVQSALEVVEWHRQKTNHS